MLVALISGSSRGIGKGIALKLSQSGYQVVVTGRNESDVNGTVAEITEKGGQAAAFVGDLTNKADIQKAVDFTKEKFGKIDSLVCNLGSGRSVRGWDVDQDEWLRMFHLNFFGSVELTRAAIPEIKEGGSITFISSIAGCEILGTALPYTAAKSALVAYAKGLADVVAEQRIRVNTVSPGNVMFKGSAWDFKMQDNEQQTKDYIKANVPLNDFATPEDIGKLVLNVIDSPFMTGTNIKIDGGQTRGWF